VDGGRLLGCRRDLTQDKRARSFCSPDPSAYQRDRSESERRSFVRVHPFEPPYLPGLRTLISNYLSAVVPGWALPDEAVAAHLEQNYGEYVTDPWVIGRTTLLATEGWRVLAAVHLLRYADSEEVGEHLRGAGEIGWLLCVPERSEAAAAALSAVQEMFSSWGISQELVGGGVLPVPALVGVPDCWPHVISALQAAGYRAGAEHREAIYGGTLSGVSEPSDSPLPGIEVRRSVGEFGVRFSAVVEGEEIGRLECTADLTGGGAPPVFGGWADLEELWVHENSRNRGVGAWLVEHAVRWLRLAGCDRVVIAVAEGDEAAGAGRFYSRFGWEVFAREVRSWEPK
jgi:GNAT superfamily N-acetyltransferase